MYIRTTKANNMNINKDLFAQTNEGFHLVNEFTGTVMYFGLIEKIIYEDQDGEKYFMFGGSAIYIIGFRRGLHNVATIITK